MSYTCPHCGAVSHNPNDEKHRYCAACHRWDDLMMRGDPPIAADRPLENRRWLVWSEEHGAWWRPGRAGYTRSIREAGRYSHDEATAIVERANRYVENGFHEIAMFDPV